MDTIQRSLKAVHMVHVIEEKVTRRDFPDAAKMH